MIYYNTKTEEYPRHDGDLELLGWKVGQPLPENWVEVEYCEPRQLESGETYSASELPELVDGVWKTAWNYRPLTKEELKQIADLKNSGVY